MVRASAGRTEACQQLDLTILRPRQLSQPAPAPHPNACSIMGVAGYLALPGGPDSNVMNGFPASDPLMQVGSLHSVLGLQVVA